VRITGVAVRTRREADPCDNGRVPFPDAKEIRVARKTIFVSDLTGNEIDDQDGATVTIRYTDARRGQVVLDVNASEVADLASKGTKQARRGRRPKSS
jgi:hypothetical protein